MVSSFFLVGVVTYIPVGNATASLLSLITYIPVGNATDSKQNVFQGPLSRLHANGTVEADHIAIEHLIFDDMADESRVFARFAKALWKRNLGGQASTHFVAHPL